MNNFEVQDIELDADAKKVKDKDSEEKKEERGDSENVHISRLENENGDEENVDQSWWKWTEKVWGNLQKNYYFRMLFQILSIKMRMP